MQSSPPGSLITKSLPGFYVPQDLVGSLKGISHNLSMSVRWVHGRPSSPILASVQASAVPVREHVPWGLGAPPWEGQPARGGRACHQAGDEEVLRVPGPSGCSRPAMWTARGREWSLSTRSPGRGGRSTFPAVSCQHTCQPPWRPGALLLSNSRSIW